MKVKIVKVINEKGVHARPGKSIVECANNFQCKITLENLTKKDGQTKTDAKSIMGILMLEMYCGSEVKITVEDGYDEPQALDAISSLFEEGFKGSCQ